ncbi:MAG TPA: hypothetical protein VFR67_24680 [Pilimelia sp.]|nr:hypothetical protein [Pilimelia sp.]
MQPLDTYARRGLWALPVWAVLLFLATITHQPDYRTDFAGWSRYVTTDWFLASHLLGSILGAGIGILGFVALSIVLVSRDAPRLALWGLVTGVLGNTLITAVFGVAAFAQPAIGRAFLDGVAAADPLYDDVNGAPLFATAGLGVLLFSAATIVYGVAVIRTGLVPRLVGIAFAAGGPVFAVVGLILANFVQSIGAALLVVGAAWIAQGQRNSSRLGVSEPG